MTVSVYVYYRVAADVGDALRPRIVAAQQAIALTTSISGRLLARADDPLTWMEIYEGVAERARFLAALERALREVRVYELLPATERKIEVFRELLRTAET